MKDVIIKSLLELSCLALLEGESLISEDQGACNFHFPSYYYEKKATFSISVKHLKFHWLKWTTLTQSSWQSCKLTPYFWCCPISR